MLVSVKVLATDLPEDLEVNSTHKRAIEATIGAHLGPMAHQMLTEYLTESKDLPKLPKEREIVVPPLEEGEDEDQ